MMVADELSADWARVRVVQSPGDEKTYGNQDTDGSRSVRHFIQPMRQCGAAARRCWRPPLPRSGASRLARCETQLHEVVHKPSGRKLGYGELAADAAALPVPAEDQVKLKDVSAFRYIGKGNVPHRPTRWTSPPGMRVYGQDIMLPGMKFAVVARPPRRRRQGGLLDSSAAMKVPGVEKMITLRRHAGALQVQPAGRRCRHRQEHLGGTEGPRGAQDHLGRRDPTRPTTPRPIAPSSRRAVKKPGKVERNVGRRRQGAGAPRPRSSRPSTTLPTFTTRPWSLRRPPRA